MRTLLAWWHESFEEQRSGMKMKLILFLTITLTCFHVCLGQSDCDQPQSQSKCSLCLRLPGCAWCSVEKYIGRRCDTQENHEKLGCPSNHTVNPLTSNMTTEVDLNDTQQISPTRIKLKPRIGKPFRFKLKVRSAKNYPVDMYILMDLSASMNSSLTTVKGLALKISQTLGKLTTKHRLGFGSYVDKTVAPYLSQQDVGKRWNHDSRGAQGDIPYDFHHVLTFTENAAEFQRVINTQDSSGNQDIPEGLLDALMQVAVCDKVLKWKPSATSRRMVLIATDAPFHMAGEGKFGGIVKPNDGRCHLNKTSSGVYAYDKALQFDYPSVNQVFQKIREAHIQPIFAARRKLALDLYTKFLTTWKREISAPIGQLDDKGENIVQLIEKSYNEIVSKVIVSKGKLPDGVKVDVKSGCKNGKDNICNKVGLGETVSFDVVVTVTKCKPDKPKEKVLLTASGFGEVEIEIEPICGCDCENITLQEQNSTACNGSGTLVCGSCQCNPGRSGKQCQCDSAAAVTLSDDKSCMSNETGSLVCGGNGDCLCGQCQCNLIPGGTATYYGTYCGCSDFNCGRYNNLLCGGPSRGVCKCGECRCNRGFNGTYCGGIDCQLYLSQCDYEVEGRRTVCNNRGYCDCGKCVCNDFYEGAHCERCPSCDGRRCGDFKQCVLCKIFGQTPANASLCADCPAIEPRKTRQKLKELKLPTLCQETDNDGCTYYFTYNTTKNVTTVYASERKECPEGPDVLVIVLAVIGGIVGIGIILLILWKLLTAMVDRREYQKFEQDRAKSKWHREKNPLYQPATSTVQNPTFVGSKS